MSKQLSVVDELKGSIQKMQPQFKAALPKHVSAEKFSRVLMTAISSNPNLAQADRTSLFSACMTLAQQGLLADSREAVVVTFRNKQGGYTAQALPMIGGILKKIRQSGEIASITMQIIYENDPFRYWIDADGEHINHEPDFFSDRGKMIGAYALAKTKDGGVYIEVMTMADIEKVRNASRSKDSGPWSQWYEEMTKKTVLRRLSKRLPMSTDIIDFMQTEDAIIEPEPIPAPEREVSEPVQKVVTRSKSKPNRLAEIIEQETPKVEEESQQDEAPI
jgi:recombination protein RecT